QLVEEILFDPRSWAGSNDAALQRVDTGPVDFYITLASPKTVDKRCKPLNTQGVYSCFNGNRVMINMWRWFAGHPIFSSLSSYRSHVINHEVGHALGHGHDNICNNPGEPAPIMMQQTIDLDGCESNAWVYPGAESSSLKRAYARVLSDTLYHDQLSVKPKSVDQPEKPPRAGGISRERTVSAKKLNRVVTRYLYYDYIDRHQLRASDTEVARMKQYLGDNIFWIQSIPDNSGFFRKLVTHWKFKQKIYRQFGGRTMKGFMGYEPLQGYRRFLRKEESQDRFEIFVPRLASKFWNYDPSIGVLFSTPIRTEHDSPERITFPWELNNNRRTKFINGK
ncbi:MAG: DUF3152 domain-containing protein, partial [bacterium]